MTGKAEILKFLADGAFKEIPVEAIDVSAPLAGSRRPEIVPDNGKIATAYPNLRPTDLIVRWCHLQESRDIGTQNGHVWLDTDETPVVVHGACFGVFAVADVLILSDGGEAETKGESNLVLP
jgi:hypothetical protein